jgi:hypothetical protein
MGFAGRRGGSWTRTAPALVAALAVACGGPPLDRRLVDIHHVAAIDKDSRFLKVHMKDGRLFLLSDWKFDPAFSMIDGTGQLLDVDRVPGPTRPHRIPLIDVALLETNVVPVHAELAALAVITGVSLAATALCLARPKACFGSCPTFYVSDGERPLLQAEGFSDSIAPALEATDVDALYRVHPHDRDLTVRMTNEAMETHVVRRVDLLAAPRPPGGRVFSAGAGTLYQATEIRSARRCVAAGAESCESLLSDFDGREWMNQTDPDDLARREEVDLEFAGDAGGAQGLVIAARQTFVTTFLLYQAFAYLGQRATEALATLERGDHLLQDRLRDTQRLMGGIEVYTQTRTGAWQRAGEVFETGPIATDVHLLPLPDVPAGATRIRLRFAQGHWRIDWVALARLGAQVTPVRLTPARLDTVDSGGRPAASLGKTVVSLPGDVYEYHYRLPSEDPARFELFLESRGYYLEWMRKDWEKEESQWRAALLLYQPGLALRLLAPAFKQAEPEMERLFWGSRYVRHP